MAIIFDYVEDSEAFSAPDTIIVTTEGYLGRSGTAALTLSGGLFDITVNGIVDGMQNGIDIAGSAETKASKLTIGATGLVSAEGNGGGGYVLNAATAVNLTNAGTIEGLFGLYISGGDTSFTIKNSGIMGSEEGFGGLTIYGNTLATHTVSNTNTILGSINAQNSGATIKLTNSGSITGGVSLGNGKDSFTNSGHVSFFIDLGRNDDILKGGKFTESIIDAAGKDSYILGDGVDTYLAINLDGGVNTGSASKDGLGAYHVDKIDGGAHSSVPPPIQSYDSFGDIYDASNASSNIVINLDSATHFDVVNGFTKLGSKAGSTGTSDEIGVDIIKGFEEIRTGNGADLIFGSAANEKIMAGANADIIYGGKGNDQIQGQAGADDIIGEAGRDKLYGGTQGDTFFYRATTDSTIALAGRDTIFDFGDIAGDEDVIDISAIAGAAAMVLIASTMEFDSLTTTPEMRALMTSAGWTLQFDFNGDNKIDMAIDVKDTTHAITWDTGDFDLIA